MIYHRSDRHPIVEAKPRSGKSPRKKTCTNARQRESSKDGANDDDGRTSVVVDVRFLILQKCWGEACDTGHAIKRRRPCVL